MQFRQPAVQFSTSGWFSFSSSSSQVHRHGTVNEHEISMSYDQSSANMRTRSQLGLQKIAHYCYRILRQFKSLKFWTGCDEVKLMADRRSGPSGNARIWKFPKLESGIKILCYSAEAGGPGWCDTVGKHSWIFGSRLGFTCTGGASLAASLLGLTFSLFYNDANTPMENGCPVRSNNLPLLIEN
jgi:hypothetical protein